jgi:hypothetical protein
MNDVIEGNDLQPCRNCDGCGEISVRRNERGEIDYLDGTPTDEMVECIVCRGFGFEEPTQ